jgi:hypothetical protein
VKMKNLLVNGSIYGPLKDWNEVTSDPLNRNSTLLILNLKQISTSKMQGIKFNFEKILLKIIIIFHLFT